MLKITFDENGYLYPYEPIEVDLDILKTNFVDAFPNSESRQWLFNNYLKFLYQFQDEVFTYFEQWIDGSFITQKENPKDIDLVTFLDFEVWETRGEEHLEKFWKFSLEDQCLDSYLVKSYPPNHRNYKVFRSEQNRWNDLFGKDRESRTKGFLKLVFKKA